MRVVTVKAIAKELYERGHYLDELYQITIASHLASTAQ